MKKQIIVLSILFISVASFGQNMPKDGYTAIGFNVTGLASVAFGNFGSTSLNNQPLLNPIPESISLPATVSDLIPQSVLFAKRYFGSGMAARLSLGLNSLSQSLTFNDSTGVPLEYSEQTSKLSAFSFGLGLGLEKHMTTNSAKVDPYLGADITVAMLGNINYTTDNTITGDGYSSNSSQDDKIAGGMSYGLNLLGGFNYFFSDNISIGGEVGIGFGYTKMGGDWTQDLSSSFTTGGTTTSSSSSSAGTYKSASSGIGVNSYGGVNLTIYWGK